MRWLYIHIVISAYTIKVVNGQPTAFKWKEKVGNVYAGVNFSTSRYSGDLSERYNLSHLQLGWAMEGHIRYRLSEQVCLMSEIGVYYIHADQKYMKNNDNHLAFHSTNFSANIGCQWDFRSIDFNQQNIFYAFAGVGVTTLFPCTELNGITYSLRPFQTEGIAYSLWAAQFNYGLGVPVTLNPSTQLRIQAKYTHVMSDYLDDVSSQYVDKSDASELEKNLSDKRVAANLPANPVGATRGNPRNMDGYFLLTLQLIHKF